MIKTRTCSIDSVMKNSPKTDFAKPPTVSSQSLNLADLEYLALKNFLESLLGIWVQSSEQLNKDILLDSLSKISVIDFIEKTFGVALIDKQLAEFSSIQELANYLSQHKKFYRKEEISWITELKNKWNFQIPKSSFLFLLKLIVFTVQKATSISHTIEVKGLEHIPEGPCFLASNHQSKLDAFLIHSYLDKQTIRDTYAYAKKQHIKGFLRRYLASRCNVIVVDLNYELKESIQKLAEVVKQGKKVLIFPEGTRSLTGELGLFKKTYAILSAELSIPVVPIAISGAFNPGSKRDKKDKNSKITLEFLPVIHSKGLYPDQINHSVRQSILNNLPIYSVNAL